MEQFMEDLRTYAIACGLKPSTVIQNADCGGGGVWQKWESGGSCSMRTADKLRKFMADNPTNQPKEAQP